MPLAAHLSEARKRLLRSVAALAVAAITAYLFSDQVLDILRSPVIAIADARNAAINYDSITGAFDLKLRIALFGGIALSSPVWLTQLFAYLAPALKHRERRYAFGFLAAVIPLFALGCTVGVLVFPRMVELLTGFAPEQDSTLLQASSYFDFVLKLVLASGIAFTLPVFIVILNFMGALSAASIARSWRGGVIGVVVFSALVTPAADLLSMFLIAVPMTFLFVAAWFIAWLHDRRMARRTVTDSATEFSDEATKTAAPSEPVAHSSASVPEGAQ